MRRPVTRSSGFTLIEMITVLVVAGVLSVAVWRAIAPQIEGMHDATTRATLVDAADTALGRMTRELRLALPNSIRVNSDGTAIEFLRTRTGGRYRAQGDGSDNGVCTAPDTDAFNVAASRDCFEVLGGLSDPASIVTGGGRRAGCLAGTQDCVVIYNSGQPGADAYNGDNVAGVVSAVSTAKGVAITFDRSDAGSGFPRTSPQQRFHIVDGAVAFVCDGTARTLSRYAGYGINLVQSVPPAATPQRVAGAVDACRFVYTPGTATRAGLVTLQLTVSGQSASGGGVETISLLQQVGVGNAP